jgi:pimeloyl-ACP methyl ester carboxylesterase
VWNTALFFPDKVRAVAGLSVPYTGRGPAPRIQLFKNLYKDRFFYQIYFQEPGVAEAEFEADLRTSLRKIYYWASGEGRKAGPRPQKPADAKFLDGLADPDPLPAWLTAVDLDYYVGQFAQSGFRGPLNRYRTSELDYAQQGEIANPRIEQPAAFIAGALDPVLAFIPGVDLIEVMRKNVADLRLVKILDGAGHWIQQERPAEVNAALLEWLHGIG